LCVVSAGHDTDPVIGGGCVSDAAPIHRVTEAFITKPSCSGQALVLLRIHEMTGRGMPPRVGSPLLEWNFLTWLTCKLTIALQRSDDGAAPSVAGLAMALGAGSDQEYETVIREALARMVRVAERYVGDRDDAWDCAQEALILAIRKFDQFEGRSQVTSWLHRIVVNCALSHMRRRSSQSEVPIDDLLPQFDQEGLHVHPFAVTDVPADELLQRDDARRQVHQSIQALPDNYRAVLLMRDIEEMSVSDIATTLSVTENAAKVRIHRARSALRRHLEPLLAEGQL
jgi:RNA polymerase sigma-70 factor (ECF subfamily)